MRGVKIPYEKNHKYIDNIEHKLCGDCEKWHPMTNEYFYKNKSSSDGYFPYCKECAKKRSTKWQEDNYEQYQQGFLKRMREALKKPEKIQYNRQLARKQKESGYSKEYYEKNKEYFSNYYRDRRMNKTHEISDYEWLKCKEYFDNSCAYCKLHIDEHYIIYAGKLKKTDLHKEHVDHMGSNKIDNCIPSCQICNSRKWAFTLEDWYTEENENFNQDQLDKIYKWLNGDYKLI